MGPGTPEDLLLILLLGCDDFLCHWYLSSHANVQNHCRPTISPQGSLVREGLKTGSWSVGVCCLEIRSGYVFPSVLQVVCPETDLSSLISCYSSSKAYFTTVVSPSASEYCMRAFLYLRQNGSHSIILRTSICTSVFNISIWILRSSRADFKLSSWSLSKIRVPCCEACAVAHQSTWIYPFFVYPAGIQSGYNFNGPQLCESAFG